MPSEAMRCYTDIMLTPDLLPPVLATVPDEDDYLLPEDLVAQSEALTTAHPEASLTLLGHSREGRPLVALSMGQGSRTLVIKANAHAEEAAGVVTCLRLAQALLEQPVGERWREEITFHFIPTANPDGLWRNRDWLDGPFDLARFLRFRIRDLPLDDIEFGYPSSEASAVRPENQAIADFLRSLPRLDAYLSLHSMDFAGGAWFLLQAPDRAAQEPLLAFLIDQCHHAGIPLHDEDRRGQKGFTRLQPGFHTTPTVEEMQAFFQRSGQTNLEQQFQLNSMQFVQQHHGTPRAVVSELPLAYDPALADRTLAEGTRSDVERRRQTMQTVVLDDLARTLNRLASWGETAAAAEWLRFYEEVWRYRRASVTAASRDMGRYADLRATRRDWLSLSLDRYQGNLFILAAALRILSAAAHPPADLVADYEAQWDQQLRQFTAAFDWRLLPLAVQVRLQMALILGAAAL